jgi:hypothetical protein
MAFAEAGAEVAALCPSGHPIEKTRAATRVFVFRPMQALSSIKQALEEYKPDQIVPTDDSAARYLHELHRAEHENGTETAIAHLIEGSLGSAARFSVVCDRAASLEVARECGIRVPATEAIPSEDSLRKWLERKPLPVVLKANVTSGGDGVRVAGTEAEAEQTFHSLRKPPSLARAMKRALVDDDWGLVRSAIARRPFAVNAQEYVPGVEATTTLACWRGELLACVHYRVVKKRSHAGPATVVKILEDREMTEAARRIAKALELSGLHGLDYMLDRDFGRPYLIEINPRATQLCHLALGTGRDVVAALVGALAEDAIVPRKQVTESDTIAIFPQEWIRDCESAFLQTAYHDVPWQEPELVLACVQDSGKQRGWYRKEQTSNAPAAPVVPSAEMSAEIVPLQQIETQKP